MIGYPSGKYDAPLYGSAVSLFHVINPLLTLVKLAGYLPSSFFFLRVLYVAETESSVSIGCIFVGMVEILMQYTGKIRCVT